MIFAQLLNELDRQTHHLNELKTLLDRQLSLRRGGDYYHYARLSAENARVLSGLLAHHAELLEMRDYWKKRGHDEDPRVRAQVLEKIERLRLLAREVLSLQESLVRFGHVKGEKEPS